jgi:glycosyltransferase involved in cell wall biosynthesis
MALEETQALAQEFPVIAAVPQGPLRPDFARVCDVIDGPAIMPLVSGAPRTMSRRIVRNLADTLRWLVLLRDKHVDLVVTNSIAVVAPVIAGRILGIPVVVHARDVTHSRLAQRIVTLHKRFASTVIAISADVERSLGKGSHARVVCVPYGVDVSSYRDVAEMIPHDRFTVAVVGTVERRKGQDVALEAVGILHAREVDIDLVLVGRKQEPEFAAALSARADELGIADNVRFKGSVSDVDSELSAVDVVVGPSRAEPLGLALMEAMALGRPVVASRVGGIPEFIIDGTTGLLVSAGSAQELADAIHELVIDPPKARELGSAARAHVMTHFTVERTLAGYRREVNALLNGRASRPTR